MPDSPTSQPESDFVCECDKSIRSACAGEPFYKEHEGKRYCVLHFPGKEKSADFKAALQKKLEKENFDSCGVWFPEGKFFGEFDFTVKADFRRATFSVDAYFGAATFSADANFGDATLNGKAYFSKANQNSNC